MGLDKSITMIMLEEKGKIPVVEEGGFGELVTLQFWGGKKGASCLLPCPPEGETKRWIALGRFCPGSQQLCSRRPTSPLNASLLLFASSGHLLVLAKGSPRFSPCHGTLPLGGSSALPSFAVPRRPDFLYSTQQESQTVLSPPLSHIVIEKDHRQLA